MGCVSPDRGGKPIERDNQEDNKAEVQPPNEGEDPNKVENREQAYIDKPQEPQAVQNREEPKERREEDKPQEGNNQYPALDHPAQQKNVEEGGNNPYVHSPGQPPEESRFNRQSGMNRESGMKRQSGMNREGQSDPHIVVVDRNDESNNYQRDPKAEGGFDNYQAVSEEKAVPEVKGEESQVVPDEEVPDFRKEAVPINFAVSVG